MASRQHGDHQINGVVYPFGRTIQFMIHGKSVKGHKQYMRNAAPFAQVSAFFRQAGCDQHG